MSESSTNSNPVLRNCHRWSDVPIGPHAPHGWKGRICPGLDELEALTLSQVEQIAEALDTNPYDLARKLFAHGTEADQ